MNETLGWNLILIGNLVRPFLNARQREVIDSTKGDDWYPAEHLVALLGDIEKSVGREQVMACGKGIYYALKEQLEQTGVRTPLQAVISIVTAYPQNNRGESVGEWRIHQAEAGHVVIEDNTIYDCALGEGVVLGAVRAFGGRNVRVVHSQCKKRGGNACINEATWTESA